MECNKCKQEIEIGHPCLRTSYGYMAGDEFVADYDVEYNHEGCVSVESEISDRLVFGYIGGSSWGHGSGFLSHSVCKNVVNHNLLMVSFGGKHFEINLAEGTYTTRLGRY